MKLKLIIATFLSMFLFSAAQAGSFGMGVTGGLGMIGAAGSETNSESGSETETGFFLVSYLPFSTASLDSGVRKDFNPAKNDILTTQSHNSSIHSPSWISTNW